MIRKFLMGFALGVAVEKWMNLSGDDLPLGQSSFFMKESLGVSDDDIPVYYYRSSGWTQKDDLYICFPGYTRNAKSFLERLIPVAEEYNLLIVCPEFSEKKYPGACWYQEGNISDLDDVGGVIQKRSQWTFRVIDKLISRVIRRTHAKGKIILFGHSAGAQLMHRYSLFGKSELADEIICANAGWFTFPDFHVPYPYGLQGLPYSEKELKRALGRKVIHLMGGDDLSREAPFRTTKEADAQGLNRMERCNNYFHYAESKAYECKCPFHWELKVIPGVKHQGVKMFTKYMEMK